jgi:hypothetical protein
MADRRLLKGISVCGSILAVDAPAMPPPEERAKRRFPNEIDVDLSDGPRQSVHVAIDHDLNERGDGFTLKRSHFTTTLGYFLIARHQGLFRYKESKSGGAVFGCGRRVRDGWRKRKGPRSGVEPFGNSSPKAPPTPGIGCPNETLASGVNNSAWRGQSKRLTIE